MSSPTTWDDLQRTVALFHEELLTATEAAARIGVSTMTVYRRIKRGELRAITFGRDTYVFRGDLKAAS